MRGLIFLCLWMSMCSASQDDRELEIFLSTMIKEDNNKPVGSFITHEQVEQKKRELNNGMLPLSPEVKDQMKSHLWSHFEQEHEAIDFFRAFAVKHSLYPLSVEKTIVMIQSEYAVSSDAVVSKQVDKVLLELDALRDHSVKLHEELQQVQDKIKQKQRKAQKSQVEAHPFRLPSLGKKFLQIYLSDKEDS